METESTPGGLGGNGSSLDMRRGKDREYLRRAISRGWNFDPNDLGFYAKVLRAAARAAVKAKNVREMNSCVKTAALIASMIQSDEQFSEKLERPDDPKPVTVDINVIQVSERTARNV